MARIEDRSKSQINLRLSTATLEVINRAASREDRSAADFLRVAALTCACHTFREIPPTVFIAPSEHVALDRAEALGMRPVAEVGGEWQGEVRVPVGRNGIFHDNAGGIWVLTAEGLKQVVGFEPPEEAQRLELLSKTRGKLESRSPYAVTRTFAAFRVQREEGYAPDEHRMRVGFVLFADPAYWKGRIWEGQEVVQFSHETSRFYVERRTFLSCTRRTALRGI